MTIEVVLRAQIAVKDQDPGEAKDAFATIEEAVDKLREYGVCVIESINIVK